MQKNIMMINSDISQVSIFRQYVSSCKYNLNLSKICLDYDNNAVYSVIKENYEFLVINYDLNKDFTISVLEYLRDNNGYDLKVVSSLGLDDNDLENINS